MLVNSSFLHLPSVLTIIFRRELMNVSAGVFDQRIIGLGDRIDGKVAFLSSRKRE